MAVAKKFCVLMAVSGLGFAMLAGCGGPSDEAEGDAASPARSAPDDGTLAPSSGPNVIEAPPVAPTSAKADDERPAQTATRAPVERGTVYTFGPGGNGNELLREGWSNSGGGSYVWSDASESERSIIEIPAPETPGALRVSLKCGAFLANGEISEQQVLVHVGDEQIRAYPVKADKPAVTTITIPADLLEKGEPLRLELEIPTSKSPQEAGISDDPRKLGVTLHEIRVEPAPNAMSATEGDLQRIVGANGVYQ